MEVNGSLLFTATWQGFLTMYRWSYNHHGHDGMVEAVVWGVGPGG